MSQWCRSELCGHPLPALSDTWTYGAASRHTIAPISHTRPSPSNLQYYSIPDPLSQSVSGTLDRPRVVAPSKTCGHVRSSRRRWRWAQCRPRSAAPTFGSVVHAGASTPAWCLVYRLRERPQPGVVRSGLVSLPVVAARDQKWRVASDKSGLLSLLRQFG